MSRYTMGPVFVPDNLENAVVDEEGLHNAWAVFERGLMKYCFEFEDSAEELSQRANAQRMLEWCQRREATYGQP